MLQYAGPGLFRVHVSVSLAFLLLPMSQVQLFQYGLFRGCADPKGSKDVDPHTPLHHERPADMHIHAHAPKRTESLFVFGAANSRLEDFGPSGSCIGLS